MRLGEWVPSLLFALALAWVGIGIAIGHPSYEGLAVMVAVVLATGVAFVSEYRSDREFEKLNAAKETVRVKVQRGDAVHAVGLEDVVVGERVLLEMGDEIPADGRILKANELYIDQSLMTGESEPVKKSPAGIDDTSDNPEDIGAVFRATQVVDGVGQMIVTNVGDDTMIGQIARRLSSEEEGLDAENRVRQPGAETPRSPRSQEARVQKRLTISKASTPLQEKLEVLARLISKVGYVAAVAIFIALLVHGFWRGEVRLARPGEDGAKVLLGSIRALLSYFVYMVIIIVVAVPEGLPMSVTVSLAIAWRKMSKANSLVRQLVACETIGSATVICSDKTGTLTQNKMSVSRVGLGGMIYDKQGGLSGTEMAANGQAKPRAPLGWVIVNAAVNSTANLEEKHGTTATVGNTTEGALLNWLAAGAWFRGEPLSYIQLRTQYPTLYQIHFSSDRKRMTTVLPIEGQPMTLVKGAPETILAECGNYLAPDGSLKELTPEVREQIQRRSAPPPPTQCGRSRLPMPNSPRISPATRMEFTTAARKLKKVWYSMAGWASAIRCATT